ncbi:hypothetical protein NDU88_000356 [Pleurodeles waltl]|uniref:Uncharacterized protein n=1 Tax=Pleurodeles waltl TaxID=8319 RepID=A0AAV7V847_PLEWA|nr:hypothetical protein NDU88_000356 [Pleurodeles waltl]
MFSSCRCATQRARQRCCTSAGSFCGITPFRGVTPMMRAHRTRGALWVDLGAHLRLPRAVRCTTAQGFQMARDRMFFGVIAPGRAPGGKERVPDARRL